jgi:hypothetical protein
MSMELAKYDESGLIAAKSIRAAAMRKLQEVQRAIEQQKELPLEPGEICSLASAVESAQRIARLALGASTENRILGSTPFIDETSSTCRN